jgi:hypothetical protein
MANTNKWGIVAEFDSAAAIYHAAEKTTAQGYTQVDAYTPFPVHGLDRALKQGPSHLGWFVVCCGIAGICLAQLMMWWMNAVDYPFWVSGKEPYAWPSTIPITFELMVLLSGICAVFGMFALNKLPRLHHPIFQHATFWRASPTTASSSPSRRRIRSSTAARRRASSRASAARTSRWWRTEPMTRITPLRVCLLLFAAATLGLTGCMRGGLSTEPPVHLVLDMDFQQKLRPQAEAHFEGWTDGRSSRLPVSFDAGNSVGNLSVRPLVVAQDSLPDPKLANKDAAGKFVTKNPLPPTTRSFVSAVRRR